MLPDQGQSDLPAYYILSSGGQNPRSPGFYLRQNNGQEFDVGVAMEDELWQSSLTIAWGSPCHVVLMWSKDIGLRLFIDGLLAAETPASIPRVHVAASFNPYHDLYLGKSNDDSRLYPEDFPAGYPTLSIGHIIHVSKTFSKAEMTSIADVLTGMYTVNPGV